MASIATPVPLPAQQAPEAPTVYVMTFGPGRQVWERFGHNAIWIHDPAHGTDSTYDYGRFDFNQKNFILRFIQGRMWYSMGGTTVDRYLWHYRQDNRSIWIQELDLSPEARLELQAFLQWNNRPENQNYYYDYYRDNCSTRVRDVLDRVVRGRIRAQTEHLPVAATYRFHTQRLTTNDIPIFTGLLAVLGPAVDRPLSAWQEMFLPLSLRDHLRGVTIPGPDGHDVPLVKTERTIYESTAPPPPPAPPNWLAWYLLAGVIGGAGTMLLGRAAVTNRMARGMFATVGGIWGLLAGAAGMILALLWFATDHVMAYRNLNLFQLSPFALPLAVLLPAAAFGAPWARRAAWRIATIAAGLSVAGALLQLVPGIDQVNGPIIALALPMNLGVALAARAIAGVRARGATLP